MLQWNRQSDTFPSSLSAQWVRRNGGTNPLVSGGFLTTNTTGGLFPAEFIARPAATADQYAAVTIAQLHSGTSGGSPSAIFLRSPNNATSGTIPVLFIRNATMSLYTMTSWAGGGAVQQITDTNSNGGSNMAIGSRVELFVRANVYTATYNGAVVLTWTDSTPTASQTGRYGGAIMQYASDGSGNGVMGFDNFVFGDLRPVDVPTPMQSINRTNTF